MMASEIIVIFAEKFIISDYDAEGYNETAARNTRAYPTGSCGNVASWSCHNQGY